MTAMKEQPSARQIYGTIGPACADVETLEAMFRAGMTGIRLNLSHVTLAQAADQVDALHKAAQRCGKQAELLIDMQGPELRVGVLAEPMTLNEGEVLELGGKGFPCQRLRFLRYCPDRRCFWMTASCCCGSRSRLRPARWQRSFEAAFCGDERAWLCRERIWNRRR